MNKISNDKDKSASSTNGTKIGVFICHCGGNIGDVVDVESVKDKISEYPGVSVAEVDMFMCSNTGQNRIAEKIKDGSYQFEDKDLGYMTAIEGSNPGIMPFRELLRLINQTHRKGLESD